MPKQGTIVPVPFPFTDLTDTKVRPAVVLSSFKKGEDVVVAFISSQKEKRGAFDIEIVPSQENGLRVLSKIKCAKLATLDIKIILGELGLLSRGWNTIAIGQGSNSSGQETISYADFETTIGRPLS